MSNTTASRPTITYGLSCERTPARTAILTALVHQVRAHRALKSFYADGSGWDLALLGESAATHDAIAAIMRVASQVLPPGQVGGELLSAAINGAVPGLDV